MSKCVWEYVGPESGVRKREDERGPGLTRNGGKGQKDGFRTLDQIAGSTSLIDQPRVREELEARLLPHDAALI